MAVPTNTFTTYDTNLIREDLSDIAYDISPEETSFMANIGKSTASATYTEWPVDGLDDAVDTNAALEGDDATTNELTAAKRIGNFTQISRKVARVAGTSDAVDSAANTSKMDYQVAKKLRELKTDVEKQMLSNKPSVAGAAGTARQSASFVCFLQTNVDAGAGGSAGGFASTTAKIADAPSNGTQRAFSETILKNVMKKRAEAGNGSGGVQLYLGAHAKTVASGFAGISEQRTDAPSGSAAGIVGAADTYLSDFGLVTMIYSQHILARNAYFVDPNMVEMRTLRDFQSWDLAKTGDSDRKQLLVEYTLCVKNEKAHGAALDLSTS